MDLTFGLKSGHELADWFLKLRGVFSWVGSTEIWRESDATLGPLHYSYLGPRPYFCSRPIGLLDFGVVLVLDPSVNPPLVILVLWLGIGPKP